MDAIPYAGRIWLVPQWVDDPAENTTRPVRIVLLETMAYRRSEGAVADFFVEEPAPKYVFEGRIPLAEADKYVVIEDPSVLALLARASGR